MRRAAFCGAVVMAALFGLACRPGRASDASPPPPQAAERYVARRSPFKIEDFLAIRTWLLARRFDDLDRRLEGLQDAYERGERTESDVSDFFAMFVASDPAYGPLLDEWTRARPRSFSAQAALGIWHVGQAWLKRDYRSIQKTSGEQVREMDRHLALSRAALESALARRPRLMAAHVRLIEGDMLGGTRQALDRDLERALSVDPASFEARSYYLNAIRPRWHGSRQEMQDFAAQSQRWSKQNPKLVLLQGYVAVYVDLYDARARGDAGAELRSADEALAHGEHSNFLVHRAEALVSLRRYDEAAAEADRALQIRPHSVAALRARGTARWWGGKREAGLQDLHTVLALDPADSMAQRTLAVIQASTARPQEAAESYDKVVAARPYSADAWARKGLHLIEQAGNAEEGEAACRHALEIDRDDPQGLLCDALIRARKNDSRYRASLEAYLEQTKPAEELTQIADRLERGRGLPKDDEWAVRLFRQAAQKGEPYALADLGSRMLDGRGVKKDVDEAARLVRRSAELGDAWGMRLTGVCYDLGAGVARNFAEARRWYDRAARAGDLHARHNLGLLYWDGRGVAADRVVAHVLISGAVARGDADATAHLAELERAMTNTELENARRKAAALPDGLP